MGQCQSMLRGVFCLSIVGSVHGVFILFSDRDKSWVGLAILCPGVGAYAHAYLHCWSFVLGSMAFKLMGLVILIAIVQLKVEY